MQAIGCTHFCCERSSAGNMIGLNVSVNYMNDFHSFGIRKLDVAIHIAFLGVYDRRHSFTGSTEYVCSASVLVIQELFKNHDWLLIV